MTEEQADTPASDFTGLDTPIGESRPESELRRPGSDLLGRRESTGELDGLEDHLFDVQLTQITEDPNQVNVHQFYPILEHQFMKAPSEVLAIKDKKDEDLQDGKLHDSSQTTDSQMQIVPVDTASNTPWSKEDENNSSDPQAFADTKLIIAESIGLIFDRVENVAERIYMGSNFERTENILENVKKMMKTQNTAQTVESEGVFSTAVDEKTLQEAKSRQQQSIFQTEQWGPEKPVQPSMKQIMEETADKHFNKALQMKAEGNHKAVLLWIHKALAIKGEETRFFVERAEAYIKLCDLQSAILNYKKACLLEPSNDDYYNRLSFLYFFQGQCLFDQRLYPEALEAFSRAAEMRPDNVEYHIRSITCLAALQRHGECLALVNKRLDTDKDNADLYVMRARLHEMFRNTTLCYYDVKDALGLDSEHPEARRMMDKLEKVAQDNKKQAMQLNLMGKHREALQKISIAIETDPAIADFHVLRGALHRKLGDYNAAIDDFLLALDKCDHDEESDVYIDSQRQLLLTYNDFAVECFTKGFFEEAIILLNKAIKGEKREKGLYINRGDCFFRQEEYNFALQDYHQALEMDIADETVKSRISVIHNEFGVAAYQEKLYMEAEKRFTQALEYHPKVGQYYISRARARYMLENMTGARGDLLMGLLLDPQNEDVISILSRLFPGKSVGEVLQSRAAESAKMAIRSIFAPPKPEIEEDQETLASDEEVETGSEKGEEIVEAETQSVLSERSSETASHWKPADASVSEFRFMMEETEFNIKMVEIKQDVNSKVKSALIDRKSLKYDGPRMQPLPPPNPKPTYGGRAFRHEKMIQPGKKRGYNWKQFNSGIGLGGN